MLQYVLILLLFVLLLAPSATPLSFQFSNFNSLDYNTELYVEGDAYIDPPFRSLTKSAFDQVKFGNVGRATYKKPFLLYNKATGEFADFETTYKFSIYSQNNPNSGDGLAFFIAPSGSSLNVSLGGGASLGLPFNISTANYEYPFVAVEFDINRNLDDSIEDPSWIYNSYVIDDHVGIDVNSLKSFVAVPWDGSIFISRSINTATVSYNSTTNFLNARFTNRLGYHR